MTFDDVKKFAKEKGLTVDEDIITIENYHIYRDGFIWLNAFSHGESYMSISYLITSKRTPKQLKSFIESLL